MSAKIKRPFTPELKRKLRFADRRLRFITEEEIAARKLEKRVNDNARVWDGIRHMPWAKYMSKRPDYLERNKAIILKYSQRTYVGEGCHLVEYRDGREMLIRTGGPERIVGAIAHGRAGGNDNAHSSVTAEKVIRMLAERRGITETEARSIVYEMGHIAQDMILNGELYGIPFVGVIYLKCEPGHRQRLKMRTTELIRSLFDLNGTGIYNYEDAIYDARQEVRSRKYGKLVKPYVPRAKRYTDKQYVIESIPTEHGIRRRVRFVVEPKKKTSR